MIGDQRVRALLPLLAVAAFSTHDEQTGVPEHPGEEIREAPAVSISRAESECLELPRREPPAALSDRLIDDGCEVVASGVLGATGSRLWRWVRYRRLRVYGPEADTPPEDLSFFPDSTREDELVLFTAQADADSLRPVWRDRSDAQIELIRDPFIMRLGEGAVVLLHRRCLNGTGGCADYPYQLTDAGAITPLQMRYVEQMLDALPEGWGMWKGIWLHRDRPSAWAAVYVPGDANCCPSFLAAAPLRMEHGELKADSVVIAPDTSSSAWKVLPPEAFGHIHRRTSEVELVRRYGAAQVRSAEVHLSEGFCSPGALVFPGTDQQVEVAWADSARTGPAFVRTRRRDAPWRTWSGVGPGVSLDSLESIAGRPLELYGFGWDFGGLMKWTEEGGSVTLMMAPVPFHQLTTTSDPRADELWGDRVLRSDHPILQRMHIEVREMRLDWARPGVERDCEGPIDAR